VKCGSTLSPVNALPDTDAIRLEHCEIRRWRGYRTSSFFAITSEGDVVAESASFRSGKPVPSPDAAEARAAYDEVVAAVSADGWTIAEGPSGEWYETRFTRPSRAPVVAQPAPPPHVPQPPEPPAPPVASSPSPQSASTPPVPRAAGPDRNRTSRRRLTAVGGTVILLAAAAATLAFTFRGSADAPAPTRAAVTQVVPRKPKPATTTQPAVTAAAVVARTALVDLRIVAGSRGSWLEIRRRSASGPVLYEATLEPGQQLHLRGGRLWGLFGAAANLSITDNGRRVELSGTQKKLFVP
jgi:hypothetical protein